MFRSEVKKLRYIVYFLMFVSALAAYVYAPYKGFKIVNGDPRYTVGLYFWIITICTVGSLAIYGLYLISLLLSELENERIFTEDNANTLRHVDKLIIIAFWISIAANVTMAFEGSHHPGFVILWAVFVGFLVVCHLVCKPLYMIVEKSVDMKTELDAVV